MDDLVIRLGMIGCSPGNGHPFSFSAIINGYEATAMAGSGWPQIHRYLEMRDPSEFGFHGVSVTHVWTQEPKTTECLQRACRIAHTVEQPEQMIGQVDAVIVARDDPDSHFRLARPFLVSGIPVFVDKPLTLSLSELDWFRPYLRGGQLMSCSAMRYAAELDRIKAELNDLGRLVLIRGAVVHNWERYGIHLLEAAFSVLRDRPVQVTALPTPHMSAVIMTEQGIPVQIDALEQTAPVFRLDFFGERGHRSVNITDNFTMFRRMLWHFIRSVREGRPVIPPETTMSLMKVLIAGNISRRRRKKGR